MGLEHAMLTTVVTSSDGLVHVAGSCTCGTWTGDSGGCVDEEAARWIFARDHRRHVRQAARSDVPALVTCDGSGFSTSDEEARSEPSAERYGPWADYEVAWSQTLVDEAGETFTVNHLRAPA